MESNNGQQTTPRSDKTLSGSSFDEGLVEEEWNIKFDDIAFFKEAIGEGSFGKGTEKLNHKLYWDDISLLLGCIHINLTHHSS